MHLLKVLQKWIKGIEQVTRLFWTELSAKGGTFKVPNLTSPMRSHKMINKRGGKEKNGYAALFSTHAPCRRPLFWSHFSGHLDIKLHACIQQPKQRNCHSSLWNHTSTINNAQFLECHVSLYNAFKERHQVLKSWHWHGNHKVCGPDVSESYWCQ